ncbi:hypothetical protein BDV23DRAFT_153841 [Aspergillus alliaceus]|uniref:Secreted protein n=1 Tax=Petromyces alliaceus TaxID=209559 RepID=A0A5N7CBL7_PETAA|nr:hypothetical protein BDV23DRAFT_153841 [Aspergillus alliaceus]
MAFIYVRSSCSSLVRSSLPQRPHGLCLCFLFCCCLSGGGFGQYPPPGLPGGGAGEPSKLSTTAAMADAEQKKGNGERVINTHLRWE